MSMIGFGENVAAEIRKRTGATVKPEVIIKNNNCKMNCLLVSDGKTNVSMIIYLDYYFKEYEDGMDYEKIVKQIINDIEKNKATKDLDVRWLMNFDMIKDKIICIDLDNTLINTPLSLVKLHNKVNPNNEYTYTNNIDWKFRPMINTKEELKELFKLFDHKDFNFRHYFIYPCSS